MKDRSHQPIFRKLLTRLVTLLCLSLIITAPRAQQPSVAKQSPEDRIALYQALLDLTNPWTVMCIAAHPDDEDGTSLIVMRRKYGAHTVSLFTTFGEGGQNAIGPELYEEMGAIRVRETKAASEIQGSEPYFLGMKDYGFSKTADEAFKIWGHEEALRRMVLQIRKLRPDVIITNHSATSNDHGQHQATARLELEAFDAAADPKRFPEQLKDGVTTWQVQRLFVRARGNAQAQAATAPTVTIDPNERDPIRETVYAEEALRALQKHATQGPWPKTFAEFAARFRSFTGQSAAPGQLPLIRYRLERAPKGAQPLPAGAHNFLDGLRLPEEIEKQSPPPSIDGRQLTEFVDDPKRVLSVLLSKAPPDSVRQTLVLGNHRLARMFWRFDVALAAAAGLSARLVTPRTVSPDSKSSAEFIVSNAGTSTVQATALVFDASYHNILMTPVKMNPMTIVPGETVRKTVTYGIPGSTPVTLPKFAHLYDDSFKDYSVSVAANLSIGDVSFILGSSANVDVAPPVEIKSVQPSLLVLTPQTESRAPSLQVTVESHLNQPAKVRVGAFGISAGRPPLSLVESVPPPLAPGESVSLPMNVRLRIEKFSSIEISVTVDKDKTRSIVTKATLPIIKADARVAPNLRVGYIRGFDFSLPNALNALGVESKELSVDEVKTADLQKYSSIVVDNRVYESKPELIAANQKLLDYANAGGTLIVFYHKSDEWNPDERRKRPQLAPYKLILGNERITDENAPIAFLEPEHPLLNSPNKMGQEDFADWIQERGLYYPKEWDPQFHALLQSNDPGEAPLKGGLLVADYGRGHYIYSSMVWYRELRTGVPGAYRMLANMISYGQAEGKRKSEGSGLNHLFIDPLTQ